MVDSRSHLLNRIEFVTNPPDHEVHICAQADRRVAVKQEWAAEFVHGLNKLFLALFLVSVSQPAPLGKGAIESKVNELAGQLRFFDFELNTIWGEAQRPSGCGAFFVSAHVACDLC